MFEDRLSCCNCETFKTKVLGLFSCLVQVLVIRHNFWIFHFHWRSFNIPYCYYYLRVLYFANFCDLEKIAKLSTRKIFYRHIWHCGDGWPLLERMLIILFWSFLPFLFFFPVPSRAWESDIFFKSIVGVSRAKLKLYSCRITGARCTIWHVSCKSTQILHCSKFSLDTATFTKQVDFKVELLP